MSNGAKGRRVAVVGGGISGLSAAHDLVRAGAEVTVFDAAERAGGLLQSERFDGYEVELGPDSILTDKPWALELARELGLTDQVISTRSHPRGAYVVHDGRLVRVPEGFSLMAATDPRPLMRSGLLSTRGLVRMFAEPLVPRRREEDDESLESFVVRRFGRELFERLAQPMVGGIYGADPGRLSLAATMPRFVEMERSHGSVIRAMLARKRAGGQVTAQGARYGLFVAFRGGMSTFVDALAARAGTLRSRARVTGVERTEGGWGVGLADGSHERFDALVMALPAHAAARLVEGVDVALSRQLGAIDYASAATVTYAFERRDVPHPLDAFGFVVPTVEGRQILAATWSSVKWEGRAPDDRVLLRVFIGGYAGQHLVQRDDSELDALARRELASLMGIEREPLFTRVLRYERAMPQYLLGHLARVDALEQRAQTLSGFALAGNAYRGVGIPDAVRSGRRAAARLLSPAAGTWAAGIEELPGEAPGAR